MAILSRPFKDLGEPILCEPQFQGAIDPYLVRDVRLDGHRLCERADRLRMCFDCCRSQKLFMSWKRNVYLEGRDSIVIREINEDGMTFPPTSKVITLLVADQIGDQGVVEGQSFIYRKPYYYMFYSSNNFKSPSYRVKVARSKSLTGPYRRHQQDVLHVDKLKHLLKINSTFVGPGKLSYTIPSL